MICLSWSAGASGLRRMGAPGSGAVLDLFVADEFGEVAERFHVGDAGEQQSGAVVVDHGQRLVAVAGAGLCDVVEDRDQLDVVGGGGGGDLGEVG